MKEDAKRNAWLLGLMTALVIISAISLLSNYRSLAWMSIVAADLYLLSILIFSAIRSGDESFVARHPGVTNLFPGRAPALLAIALLMGAIVVGFAALYAVGSHPRERSASIDALYASMFVMFFEAPSSPFADRKALIVGQLVSSILLMGGVFPLLLSRISTFRPSKRQHSAERVAEAKKPGAPILPFSWALHHLSSRLPPSPGEEIERSRLDESFFGWQQIIDRYWALHGSVVIAMCTAPYLAAVKIEDRLIHVLMGVATLLNLLSCSALVGAYAEQLHSAGRRRMRVRLTHLMSWIVVIAMLGGFTELRELEKIFQWLWVIAAWLQPCPPSA